MAPTTPPAQSQLHNPFDIDTSYSPEHHHSPSLYTHPHSSSSSLTAVAIPITRPMPAYTSSPYIFERNPDVPMPAPYEELTPPPSPQHAKSSLYSNAASATTAASQKLAPLLTRAGSVLTPKRNSASPARTTPTSSRPVSPTKSTGSATPDRKVKPMSASLADFFQVKGSSAPLSFGLVQTSPKKEGLPTGSIFGPSVDCNASRSGGSPRNVSPRRPAHNRRGSTLATAASFLGLSSPVGSSVREPEEKIDEDDEILELEVEKELLPENGTRDFDALLANASILFSRMQDAYRSRRDELTDARRERAATDEELAEQCTRGKHLKRQLGTLAERVEQSEAEVTELRERLVVRDRRARTIRVVGAMTQDGSSGERLFSAGSVSDCFDSSSEEAKSTKSYSRPSSASSAMAAEADVAGKPWRSSFAPFVAPNEKVSEENEALKKRIMELEEIVNGCLGLVDV